MQTIIIILVVISILAAVYYFGFYKQGKINDRDGDFIPDEIEDAVEDVKKVAKTVKRRAKKVKAELGDVVDELHDVVQAFKGKPTKSKLNSLTKQQLIDAAKKDHGADFDLTVKKSTLVNKVYSLYNKK
jgi:ABC-type transporter Mla subunit MlaD